jgi:predicted transglutaminase-like cysteine proteinase
MAKIPNNKSEVLALKQLSATFDARLRESAKHPIGFVEFQRDDRTIRRNRETILTQAIHHATEHRAQIAGIFANHNLKIIDLDEIDLWGFANYEGLGD